MRRTKLTFLFLAAFLIICSGLLIFRGSSSHKDPLIMYCAMGIKAPVEAIAAAFEEEHGVLVELQFEGSGTLLGKIEAGALGDLYLAADQSYIEMAQEKGLATEKFHVGQLTGVLGVAKGNPKGVRSLQELASREDLRIGIANPQAAAVGKFSRKVLQSANVWEDIRNNVTVLKPTVEALAMDVVVGALDVAIIWDATAQLHDDIDMVHVPEFDRKQRQISIGVLNSSNAPTTALRFARYLTARDRGLTTFQERGFEVGTGDAWAWQPKLVMFSGAMLRPAIHERMMNFAKREGVEISPTYNGCGILVSQMRAGAQPDAYFSCDLSFMEAVQDRFGQSKVVSANDILMLVHRDKEGLLTNVDQLGNPGVRIGLAHETDSALGKLTADLLKQMNLYQRIHESNNVQLQSPTGDMLVNQLRAGALDAVIVYRSNALASPETLKDGVLVEIPHPTARAEQPFAIAKDTRYAQLAERLYATLTGNASQQTFSEKGFDWQLSR